jgi:hypothetical protein
MQFSVTCPHGFRLIDQDECVQCVRLEAAKIACLMLLQDEVERLTDADDTATRALLMTALGRFISMKLSHPDFGMKLIANVVPLLRSQLPVNRSDRLLGQQMCLTELSFLAHERGNTY